MEENKFIGLVKRLVCDDYNSSQTNQVKEEDIYIVWLCKTLQNSKALASTSVSGDGMYYEITFNGDKNEVYLDRYKKQGNKCISL